MRDRNLLRCNKCNKEVYADGDEHACFWCDGRMKFICKESKDKTRWK
jgi:hypothetical protein